MKLRCQFALLLLSCSWSLAQVVVDRMAAVVNKRVILESEVDQTARVEFLIEGKPLKDSKLGESELLAALDQLIDRSLLEQQIIHPEMLDPSPEELARRMGELRDQVPGGATDAGWNALLSAYGVTREDVQDHVISEFRILRFVDLRFRGLVRVEKSAIATYYQEKLLPELRKRSAPEPSLADVSVRIEKILAEQQMDQMLNEWLQTLRSQAHVERLLQTGLASGAKP